jgi:hypothetical protein
VEKTAIFVKVWCITLIFEKNVNFSAEIITLALELF